MGYKNRRLGSGLVHGPRRAIETLSGLAARARVRGWVVTLAEAGRYFAEYSRVPRRLGTRLSPSAALHIPFTCARASTHLWDQEPWRLLELVPKFLFDTLLLPLLNPRDQKKILVNKVLTYRRLAELGIPFPETLLVTTGGTACHLDGSRHTAVDSLSGREIFVKPATGAVGRGAAVITFDPSQPLADGYVFQERLKPHPLLFELAPVDAFNTLRIHSYSCRDGTVEIESAHLKLSTGRITDNVGGGGIGVPVDQVSGALGGEGFMTVGPVRRVRRHPRSRRDFEGFVVPFWPEVVELIPRLHDAFPEVRCVAWDIGVTERGPVVVEGNSGGDIFLPQVIVRPFLRTRLIQENLGPG